MQAPTLYREMKGLDRLASALLTASESAAWSKLKPIHDAIPTYQRGILKGYDNQLLTDVIDGKTTLQNSFESLNHRSGWIPGTPNEEYNGAIDQLAELAPDAKFLRRRGVLAPDNTTTLAGYTALATGAMFGSAELINSVGDAPTFANVATYTGALLAHIGSYGVAILTGIGALFAPAVTYDSKENARSQLQFLDEKITELKDKK